MKKGIKGVLFCLLVCLLAGCAGKSGGTAGYQVYYVASTGTRLVEESFTPGEGTPKDTAEELLDKMGRPMVGSDHVKALPEEVHIQKCVLGARQISVDFSKEYYEMDKIREVLVRAAYVNTLIQLPHVEEVVITVDGEALIDGAGDVVGPLKADSFIDTKGAGINSYQYASLPLYFASEDGTEIVKEMRNVHYSSNSTLERVVLDELIKGPVNARLQSVLPAGTRILSVQTVDGICTVNFEGNFNQSPEADSNVTAEASLYAVVDALADACQVREVCIQVDGTSDVSYRETVDLREPLRRNSEIIQPVVSGTEDVLEPSVGVDALLKNYFF